MTLSIPHSSLLNHLQPANCIERTHSPAWLKQTDPRSPASNSAIHPTLTRIRGLILSQGLDYQPIRRWGKETMSRDKRERTKPVERLGQILFYLLRSDRSASRRQWRGQSRLLQPKPATLIFFFFYIFLSKKLQHQPGFVYFHFSWLWAQTVSLHCRMLLAPWSASRVAVKAAQMRTEMGSPEVPRQTENSKHCFLPSNRPKGRQTK